MKTLSIWEPSNEISCLEVPNLPPCTPAHADVPVFLATLCAHQVAFCGGITIHLKKSFICQLIPSPHVWTNPETAESVYFRIIIVGSPVIRKSVKQGVQVFIWFINYYSLKLCLIFSYVLNRYFNIKTHWELSIWREPDIFYQYLFSFEILKSILISNCT